MCHKFMSIICNLICPINNTCAASPCIYPEVKGNSTGGRGGTATLPPSPSLLTKKFSKIFGESC